MIADEVSFELDCSSHKAILLCFLELWLGLEGGVVRLEGVVLKQTEITVVKSTRRSMPALTGGVVVKAYLVVLLCLSLTHGFGMAKGMDITSCLHPLAIDMLLS